MELLYTKELCENDTSWTNQHTGDQEQINTWIESRVDSYSKLLHIGTGDSSVAVRFHKEVKLIDSITVIHAEYRLAESLSFSNYKTYMLDKYSNSLTTIPNLYHYVLDNNLTSYAKSLQDLTTFLTNCFSLLEPGGVIVSHLAGLSYRYAGSECGIYSLDSLEELLKQFNATIELEQQIIKIQKLS